MFQINVITKSRGWFWKREKYSLYQVVKVISASDLGDFYFPEEYEIISEHLDLEGADTHLKQLVKYNVN